MASAKAGTAVAMERKSAQKVFKQQRLSIVRSPSRASRFVTRRSVHAKPFPSTGTV
jgi:hypothetical protein